MIKNYDFSGWATKYNLKCTDGRTIKDGAFKECDGMQVPLVWQHMHKEPSNILGHGILEARDEGMYLYGFFNDSLAGQQAKALVKHKDINFLSIYANDLVEKSKNVLHGIIRETSLVLAGANPGAQIVNVSISHADTGEEDEVLDDEVVIFTDSPLSLPEPVVQHSASRIIQKPALAELEHADAAAADEEGDGSDPTVAEVFDTLTDLQKTVVYAIVAEAVDGANSSVSQSDDEGESFEMKHNVFDGDAIEEEGPTLTHDQFQTIVADALQHGSLRDSFLTHAEEYGIENIEYLFPDAKSVPGAPTFIQRRAQWVPLVLNGTYHSPFARIKSLQADITADAARAKGYITGHMKKDEVITLLRRFTNPTTMYKKQKLDRDDIVDITDIDVVAWLKGEMRMLLDEELARAIMVGDGRTVEDEDKINEACIRPIWKDADLYAHHVQVASGATAEDMVEALIRARSNYKGSGNPSFYTTTGILTEMLLTKAADGRRMYATQQELEATLRVASIVEVAVMDGLTRDTTDTPAVHLDLIGIIVNLKDYTVGADSGGEVNMFDDFDIDFNQQKYLIETRVSGALVLPKSALVIEQVRTGA